MEFVIATNNQNKLEEFKRILEPSGHTVLSLADVGVDIEVEETGKTFAENAFLKAKAVCDACGRPTIGDDSGLEVDALDGAPGIYSARFAGEHGDTEANNKKLLALLERFPYAARTARFVCVVAFVMPDGSGMEVEGLCEGRIGFKASQGKNGFGYDPLFFVGNQSFADMAPEEKDKVSHRAMALRRLLQELGEEPVADSQEEPGAEFSEDIS